MKQTDMTYSEKRSMMLSLKFNLKHTLKLNLEYVRQSLSKRFIVSIFYSCLLLFVAWSNDRVWADIPNSIHQLEHQDHRSESTQVIMHGALNNYKKQVEESLPKAKQAIELSLGLSIPEITIHLSPNKAKMRLLAEQQHKYMPPAWSAGLAYPQSQEIYLPEVPFNQLLPLLKHELVHIALGQSTHRLPLWTNEGIAVAIGEGLSWERMWRLNEAAAQQNLISFHQLTKRFPHSGTQANIAYAQSAHFIAYLQEIYGKDQFKQWLAALLQGQSLAKASQEHLKHEFWFIERSWRKGLEKGLFTQIALLFKMDTIWALSILLFVFFGFKKIGQRKQRLNSYRPEQALGIRVAHQPKSDQNNSDRAIIHQVQHSDSEQIFKLSSES